jgi:hypothetical protein
VVESADVVAVGERELAEAYTHAHARGGALLQAFEASLTVRGALSP